MTELSITTRTVLPATAPFDLTCSLRAMRDFRACAADQSVFDSGVRRAFAHPTDPARAVVTEIVGRDDGVPGVALTIFSDTPLTAEEISGVGSRVSAWLSLDDDRESFLLQARADPSMARVLGAAAGLHQVRFPSLAEGAAFFMLTHNSTQWYAAAWKRRLAGHHGPRGTVEGEEHIAFPAMSTLTALGPEALTAVVGSFSRARRVHVALSGLAALDERWLHSAPFNEVRAALLLINGIGPFTAQALLLRVLGRPDSVPLELQQFTKIATQLYGNPPPSPRELREWYGSNIGWWAYTARTALGWPAQVEDAAAEPPSVAASTAGLPTPTTAAVPPATKSVAPAAEPATSSDIAAEPATSPCLVAGPASGTGEDRGPVPSDPAGPLTPAAGAHVVVAAVTAVQAAVPAPATSRGHGQSFAMSHKSIGSLAAPSRTTPAPTTPVLRLAGHPTANPAPSRAVSVVASTPAHAWRADTAPIDPSATTDSAPIDARAMTDSALSTVTPR